MTVEELIKCLEVLDPELTVVLNTVHGPTGLAGVYYEHEMTEVYLEGED